MKVLVAYMSLSGNTKKVAEEILGEIKVEKEIKPLSEVTGLDGYDLSFIGFPIQRFGPAAEAKAFLEAQAAGKNVALFYTHAAPEDSPFAEAYLDGCKEAAAKANVVGMFDCQGEMAEYVKTALLNMGDPTMRAWVEGDTSQGQPDATRLARARTFAREVMAKQS